MSVDTPPPTIVFDVIHYLPCPQCADGCWTFDEGTRCPTCEGDEKNVFHRIYVETSSSNPKDRPVLTCHIVRFAPNWKDPVDGEKFRHGPRDEEYGIRYTTKFSHFDFTFTTDDSDVGVFEPHIDEIIEILWLSDLLKLRTAAIISTSIKKKSGTGAVDFSDELVKKTLFAAEQRIIAANSTTSVMEAVLQKSRMRWLNPIAHTLINAIYQVRIAPVVPSTDKKPCPHVGRK